MKKSFIDSVVSNLAIVDKLNFDLSRHRVSDCHFYHGRPDTAKQSTQLEPSPLGDQTRTVSLLGGEYFNYLCM